MILENLLLDYGAKIVHHPKGTQLFREGDTALNYYQVFSGEDK